MDDIDRQLVALLRTDARRPVASLAKALKVSRGTVQNRMRKLEADGTIAGYTVRLRPRAEGHRIRALTNVAVEGNRSEQVLKALAGGPTLRSTMQARSGSEGILKVLSVCVLHAHAVARRCRGCDVVGRSAADCAA